MGSEIPLLLKGAIAIVVIFFTVVVLTGLVKNIDAFKRELKYFNMEIDRSEGDRRKHWQKKKRQLWLSLLPFYRR